MALIVQLYGDGRSAERHELGADATLRGADRVPVDILVVDLSQTGCLFVTTEPLGTDAVVTIGIAGVGLRDARIVRNQDVRFGCTFLIPLTHAELAAGLDESETVAFFPFLQTSGTEQETIPVGAKLSRPIRLVTFLGLFLASWVFVAVLVRLL